MQKNWSKYSCTCKAFNSAQCICTKKECEMQGVIKQVCCGCENSYRECLKNRGIDLKKNGEEMAAVIKHYKDYADTTRLLSRIVSVFPPRMQGLFQ